jgi:surfactin synthase thioesterase subunit
MVTLDEARDWQCHTKVPIDLRVLHGGHFLLADDPAPVVEAITEQLAAFPALGPPGRAQPPRGRGQPVSGSE